MIKKITDERLKEKNLQHIRIVYIVQTLGILCILLRDFIAGKEIFGSALFFVFILSMVVSGVLQMRISVEHEDTEKKMIINSSGKVIGISLLIGGGIVIIYKFLSPERSWIEASIAGGIVSVCIMGSGLYLYWLRKRAQDG